MLKKFPELDQDVEDFQNLTISSSSKGYISCTIFMKTWSVVCTCSC